MNPGPLMEGQFLYDGVIGSSQMINHAASCANCGGPTIPGGNDPAFFMPAKDGMAPLH
jgi:hypothetical protein